MIIGKLKDSPVIHPVLFGAFPVLFLYAQNADEMKLTSVPGPLLLSCGLALALALVVGLALRNLRKGAVIATATMFLFLSFGHFVAGLPEFEYKMAESVVGPNLLILIISLVLLFVIARSTIRTRRSLSVLTNYLNLLGLALVLMEVIHGGVVLAAREDAGQGQAPISSEAASIKYKPDIYYIIIDGYGRSDILREVYGFDNSEFISELRDLGFFVADSSYTNYPQTLLSLGSSLNLDHIENVGEFARSSTDRVPLEEKVSENRVMEFLSGLGYTTVGFSTAYSLTDLETVDRRFAPGWSTNEFESMLISTTPLPLFSASSHSPLAMHRRRVSYVLDKLPRLSDVDSPKFVFAHIVSPHPPFLFDADGNSIEIEKYWSVADGSHRIKDSVGAEEYKRLYRGQAEYITRRLLKTLSELIENTKDDPAVIIVQSDHGPGSGLIWGSWKESNLRERFGILNAYYLPGLPEGMLYDEITPVNTFRIVFNQYFGTDLALLPDKHEFAMFHLPYAFHRVTNALGGSAYTHLQTQYNALPPDTISIADLSEPLKHGARFYEDGVHPISECGLVIELGSLEHFAKLEVSVEFDGRYDFQFRYDSTVVGSFSIPHHKRPGGGEMYVVEVPVPSQAQRRGYNNIAVFPRDGDGAYLIGHLVPL